MPTLSDNAKQAIKIALAMTIAYYIGMRLQWTSSTWIATSVAFVSLASMGQSLQKSALRMAGTLVAMVVGLFYLGLFPQDRWLFFLSFTPYLAFVTYKMTGSHGQYFWFVAAFVAMMITTAGPGSSEHAFNFAMTRGLETLLGIGVWALVSVFIWPTSSRAALVTTGTELLEAQSRLVQSLYRAMTDAEGAADLAEQRVSVVKLAGSLRAIIGAAASESYEVRVVRLTWMRLHASCLPVMETVERLRWNAVDIEHERVREVFPELRELFDEIEANLSEASRVLGGATPDAPRAPVPVPFNEEAIPSRDHFHRAAVEATCTELERLASASRQSLACVLMLKGYAPRLPSDTVVAAMQQETGPLGFSPLDPDRVRATVMVVASMWIGALVWIFVDPPGHISWYQFVPNLTLVAAQTPHLRFTLLKPLAYAYVVGLIIYVLVMPQLSSFWQIGAVIFVFTWVAAYFFPGLGRIALYLALLNMLALKNQQTYDFAQQANTLLFTLMGVMMVVALTYIMRSPRPEKAFLSLGGRFFRSCEYLVAWAADPLRHEGFLARIRRAHHMQEMRTLPEKLTAWAGQIDSRQFPGNSPEQVQALLARMQLLAYRIDDLIAARRARQSTLLVRSLRDDVRAWRIIIERTLGSLSERLEVESADELHERLAARMAHLNARVEDALNQAGDGEVSEEERINLYMLLGALRSLSETGVDYTRQAAEIDWAHWREERFS